MRFGCGKVVIPMQIAVEAGVIRQPEN